MNSMMEYKGYHASIEYDADDNIFVGEVFGIADSLNFHGSTVEELQEMFCQCIDNYLDLCRKIGKNPDKEFKGTFNVRIPPELHRKAALEAAKQNITLNQFVVRAIDRAFEKTEESTCETIIYIPYEVQSIQWDIDSNYMYENQYDESLSMVKEETITYAAN